jgi:hypothetical protein
MKPVAVRRVASGAGSIPALADRRAPRWAGRTDRAVGLPLRMHGTEMPVSQVQVPIVVAGIPCCAPKPEHSMMAGRQTPDPRSARATPQAPIAPPHPLPDGQPSALEGMLPSRISRPAAPATGPPLCYHGGSAEPRRVPTRHIVEINNVCNPRMSGMKDLAFFRIVGPAGVSPSRCTTSSRCTT